MKNNIINYLYIVTLLLIFNLSTTNAQFGAQWFNIDFSTANPAYATGFGTVANGNTDIGNLNLNTTYNFDLWDYDPNDATHQAFGPSPTPDGITDFTIEFVPVITYNGANITNLLDGVVDANGDIIFDSNASGSGANGNDIIDLTAHYNTTSSGRVTTDREINDFEALHEALEFLGIINTQPTDSLAGEAHDAQRIADGVGTLDGFEAGLQAVINFTSPIVYNSNPGGVTSLNNSGEVGGDNASVRLTSGYSDLDTWENSFVTSNGSLDPTGSYHAGGYTASTDGTWASLNDNSNTDYIIDPAQPIAPADEYAAPEGVGASDGPDDNVRVRLTETDPGNGRFTNLTDGTRLTTLGVSMQTQIIEDPRRGNLVPVDYQTGSSSGIISFDDLEVFLIPEPSSSLLLIISLSALLMGRKRRA